MDIVDRALKIAVKQLWHPLTNALDSLYQRMKILASLQVAFREGEWEFSRASLLLENGAIAGDELELIQADREQNFEVLEPLQQAIELIESDTRISVDNVSRPTLRPLKLLEMPDEVLIKIFDYVKGWTGKTAPFYELGNIGEDVKNLRLTCRRFCSTSSDLLLRFVRVELTPSSLSQFEEISRHPTISKGVRCVRVVLPLYNATLAQDISTFAQHNAQELRDLTETMELLLPHAVHAVDLHFPTEKVAEELRNAWNIVDIWESYAINPKDLVRETDLIYCGVLQEAHERYRQHFQEQVILRKDAYFIKAVAAAIARMPTVDALEICDFDYQGSWRTYSRSWIDQVSDKEALGQNLLVPMRWEQARRYELGDPPTEILVKLPAAIHQAGGLVTALKLELSFPESYATLTQNEEDLVALKASVQGLKHFKLRARHFKVRSFGPPVPEAEVEHIKTFLHALLDTQSLEHLFLDFGFLWDRDNMPSSTSLGSLFTFRSWPKLRHLFWRVCPLHLEEFKQFIGNLSTPIEYMGPHATHLLSGTWAEALDVLRRKAKYTTIECPSGGGLEDMPKEEREDIFPRRNGRPDSDSKAEQYVAGKIEQNPLRKTPALASEAGEVGGDDEMLPAAEI